MKKFNFTLVSLFIATSLISTSACFAAETAPFERLIDVDYSFFMTKTKLPWGIDPFQKEPGFAKSPVVDEKFELTGILYSKDEPMAIVNGKSVGAGDLVGDRHVEEIGENFVILKKQGSEIELNLPPLSNPASDEDLNDDEDDEESGK